MALLDVSHIETYYGDSHILFDLSLSVEPGEVVCLLGRNGAGKTTTIRSIAGLTPPRTGTITLRGTDHPARGPRNACRSCFPFCASGVISLAEHSAGASSRCSRSRAR
jgi:branched-chain amino acid transport system ATP-binding protein